MEGPGGKGEGQLEANVMIIPLQHILSHVLLCAGGLDVTLAISLSLYIILNNHHPSEKAIKLGKAF